MLVVLAAALPAAGCHNEERLRERLRSPEPVRLPVEPDQPRTPPAPAILDTVRQWEQPANVDTSEWQLATAQVDDRWSIHYRVPLSWPPPDERGRAASARRLVRAEVVTTPLGGEDLSLATYAAQLAEGNPLWQYTTEDGHPVYRTTRRVSVAPSDRNAPSQVFNTAVLEVDGRIVKLDVRYDASLDFRFHDLAAAITGTVEVRRRPVV